MQHAGAVSTLRQARFAELDGRTLHDLVRLRIDVFVVEQQCPYAELDGRDPDPDTWHVWAEDSGVVGYLRLLTEPDRTQRIGRVCVAAAHRGTGLAGRLLARAVELASAAAPGAPVVLDAQSHLAPWYERRGFAVAGSEFVEDGIPHLPMRLA